MNVRKCNLKQQWETTIQLLEYLKLEKKMCMKKQHNSNSIHYLWGYEMVNSLLKGIWNGTTIWETVWQFSKELCICYMTKTFHFCLPMRNAENKCPHRDLFVNFIPSLFVIAKNFKQLTLSSKDEWWNKWWFIHTIQWNTPKE